jgi:uncharacterized membrane protein
MVRRQIGGSLLFAALMLAASWGLKQLVAAGVIDDPQFPQRVTMAIIGAMLAFLGNAIPKTLTPMAATRCDPAKMQSLQRFAGYAWVITGLIFSLVWLFLPKPAAQPLSVMVVLFGTLAVAVRIAGRKRFTPAR